MSALASLFVVALQVAVAGASEVSPHGFLVVPGAEEVRRETGLSHNVHYFVEEPYPATRTIESIVAAL